MLKAVAFYDWLTDAGFQPELVEDDEEIIVACPLCNDDRPRLYINTERGSWICFHCSEQGGIYRFIQVAMGCNSSEAFDLQRKFTTASAEDPDDFFDARILERKQPVPQKLELPMSYRPAGPDMPTIFKQYLAKRGLSPELAQARGIGYSESGRYNHRVIIPVVNDGHLHTFIARTVLTQCPNCMELLNRCVCRPIKYPKVLTPSTKHGATPGLAIYNFDAVMASAKRPAIVMEGWADCLASYPEQAVALMGSKVSKTQLVMLTALGRQHGLILCLDGDFAGVNGSLKIAEALAAELIRVRVAVLPEGSDPGKLIEDGKKSVLDACIKASRSFMM